MLTIVKHNYKISEDILRQEVERLSYVCNSKFRMPTCNTSKNKANY